MYRVAGGLLLAALLLASSAAHAASIAFGLPIRPDSSPTIAISWSTSSECYFQDRNADGTLNQDDVCLNASAAGTTFSGLTDTTFTGLTTGHYTFWDGLAWVNGLIDLADTNRHTGLLPLTSLAAITDVDVTSAFAPVNYTPSAATVRGHLEGIDDAILTGGGGTPGNPTAQVGLTPVNGVASTYMRSDAAPPIDPVVVQRRVSGSCPTGQSIRVVSQDGTVTCDTAPVAANPTAVVGVTAVNGTSSNFLRADAAPPIDPTAVQRRVSGTCAATTAIRTVNQDGTVVCEPTGSGGSAPGGSTGELQYNNAGVLGGITGSNVDGSANVTFPADVLTQGEFDAVAKAEFGGFTTLKEATNATGGTNAYRMKVQDEGGTGAGITPGGADTGGSFGDDGTTVTCELHESGKIPVECTTAPQSVGTSLQVNTGGALATADLQNSAQISFTETAGAITGALQVGSVGLANISDMCAGPNQVTEFDGFGDASCVATPSRVQVNTGGLLAAADFQDSAAITFAEAAGAVTAGIATGGVALANLNGVCAGPGQIVEYAAAGAATCIATPTGGGGSGNELDAAAGNTGSIGSGQANDICNVFRIEADQIWEDCRQVENTGALTFGGGFVRRIRDSGGNITLDSCHAPHSDALGDGGATNNAIRDFIANCTTYWLANSNNNVFGGPKFVFPDGSRYGLGTATANRITIPSTAAGYTWHGTPEFILTGSGSEDSDATTCTGTAGERTLTIPDGQCSTAGVETSDTLDIDHAGETQYVVQKCEPDGANPDIVTLHMPLQVTASATACTFYHNKIIVDEASGGIVHPGTSLRMAASLNPTAALGCDAADATCGTRTFPINFWVAQADRHDYAMDIVYGDSTANSTPHKDDLAVVRAGDDDSDVNFRFRGKIRYDVGIPNVNTESHPAAKYNATQRGIGCGVFIGGNAAEFDLPASKATNGGYCGIRMGGRSGYSVIDLKNVGLENYLRPIVTGSRDLAVYNLGREYVGHHGVGTPPPIIEVQSTDAAQTGRVLRVTGGRVELGAGSRYVIGGTCDINATSGCPELLVSIQKILNGGGPVDPTSNFPVKVIKDTTQKHERIQTECAHNDNPAAKYHGNVWEPYYPVQVIRLMCDVDVETGAPTVNIQGAGALDMFPADLACTTAKADVCDTGDNPGGGDCAVVATPTAEATMAAGDGLSIDVSAVGDATRMSICWNYRYL